MEQMHMEIETAVGTVALTKKGTITGNSAEWEAVYPDSHRRRFYGYDFDVVFAVVLTAREEPS